MTTPELLLRPATLHDVPEMARIESSSWAAPLATPQPEIERRVRTYPEGQWIAERDHRIVAMIATQRVSTDFFFREPIQYDRLTDRGSIAISHDPAGDVFQLIGVSVDPTGRGYGLGRTMVNAAVQFARSLADVQRILGFTRPIDFSRHPNLTLEQYLNLTTPDGHPIDPVVSMHTRNGARLLSLHPNYRPADIETRGYGILIEYPR